MFIDATDLVEEFTEYLAKECNAELMNNDIYDGVYDILLKLSNDKEDFNFDFYLPIWCIWYFKNILDIDILKDERIVKFIDEGKLEPSVAVKREIRYDSIEITHDEFTRDVKNWWLSRSTQVENLTINPDDGILNGVLYLNFEYKNLILKNTVKEIKTSERIKGSSIYYDGSVEDFLAIKKASGKEHEIIDPFESQVYFNYNGNWTYEIKEIDLSGFSEKDLPNLQSLNCARLHLEKLILPSDLTTLPRCTIKGFGSLKEVVIPKTLCYIHRDNFNQCSNLIVSIPQKIYLDDIEAECFKNCKEVHLDNLILRPGLRVTSEWNWCNMLIQNEKTEINNFVISGRYNKKDIEHDVPYNTLEGAIIHNLYVEWFVKYPKLSRLLYCKKIDKIIIEHSNEFIKYYNGIAYEKRENKNTFSPFAISSEAKKEELNIPYNINYILGSALLDLLLPDLSKYTNIKKLYASTRSDLGLSKINNNYDVVTLPPNLEEFSDRYFNNISNGQVNTLKFGNKLKEIPHRAFDGSNIKLIEFSDDANPIIYSDSFAGLNRDCVVKYKGNLYKPSEVYATFKNIAKNAMNNLNLFRISDNYRTVVARKSSRAPAGMLAVSSKVNQGLQGSDAPVFFKTEEEAKEFARKIGEDESMIHPAKLGARDLQSGFSEYNTPYGKVLLQNWKNMKYAKEELEKMNENINEAFEPWKADAWLNGERNENVGRMNPDTMMAYNNYLDNIAYQALRANDRVKAMKCVNLMRQILIAARNRGFNTTAERINQIIEHRRSEIDRARQIRDLNNQQEQPARGGLFNPEPVEEDMNEELSNQQIDKIRIKLRNITNYSALVNPNGYFTINNVMQSDVNRVVQNLQNSDIVAYVNKTAGRFDFRNAFKASQGNPDKYWTVQGKVKENLNDDLNSDLNEEVEIHDTLNPAIWNEDNTLKPEVAQKAKEVAQIFVDILTENGVKIKVTDIYLVGSNANYNYNEASDIDIHLIADPSLDCDDQHLKLIYDAYKTLFNRKYDISFKGINVEVYVELGNRSISGGVYSIRNNKWIQEPDRNNIPEIDQEAIGQGLAEWTQKYEEITASPTIEEIDKYIDELYNLRINSFANEGEFGTGNLIFKEVRRNGILDNLKDLKTELENKQMSLESLVEDIMTTTGNIIL